MPRPPASSAPRDTSPSRARGKSKPRTGSKTKPRARAATSASSSIDADRELLLAVLRGSIVGGWQGPTLTSALRDVSAAVAATQIEGRKSIWQQCLHIAFWKQRVLNRVTGQSTRFQRRGQNWPDLPADPTEEAWIADRRLMHEIGTRLIDAVALLTPERYTPRTRKMIFGIAAHDAYHTGQINLLRRMLGDR